jgi:glycosyltransferase involved in cell wall biosynthesis
MKPERLPMIEVSVVIPCLNEEKSIGICVKKALESFKEHNLEGEVVVVDNGSTDRSAQIANGSGARVVVETEKGYGSALRRGINEAYGKYIVMGDGDDTYDFSQANLFVDRLKEGFDLVMGSRFKGQILPGAMSWSHRYVGNPILSGMLRLLFGGTVSDSHCGLRAFTKEAFIKMDLHTTGMEFASEMVIHSMKKLLKISEIPITYYPRLGQSKLESLRDAWRHIRFMLVYSPDYLFFVPGSVIFGVGFAVTIKMLVGTFYLWGRPSGPHVMIFSSLFMILGWAILNIGLLAKVFARSIAMEDDKLIEKVVKVVTLERAIVFGAAIMAIGLLLVTYIFYVWYQNDFGFLDQLKVGMFALALIVMGIQTIFNAFLFSLLQIKYNK